MLELPTGFDVGALFGRQGRHLREVKSRSGARIRIDGEAGVIIISGNAASVATATRIYQQQFAASRGFYYMKPAKSYVMLNENLAAGAVFAAVAKDGG